MDSAVHAADSSSASANTAFAVASTEWASAGILRIQTAGGPSFLVRESALALRGLDPPQAGDLVDSDGAASFYSAARAFLAERAALAYLSRAEECEASLSRKLQKKGYTVAEIREAFDVLREEGSLSDARYASAWLRNRAIGRAEGKAKLLASLLTRGIDRRIAEDALATHFVDVDERELCLKAIAKLERLGKSGDALVASLSRRGFSGKLIRDCVKNR